MTAGINIIESGRGLDFHPKNEVGPLPPSLANSRLNTVLDLHVQVSPRVNYYLARKLFLGRTQEKKKVDSMTIDGFEAIVDFGEKTRYGDKIKECIPFLIDRIELGGNGGNFLLSNAAARKSLDPNFKPGSIEVPEMIRGTEIADNIEALGFETTFTDEYRRSLVMPDVGNGLILSCNGDFHEESIEGRPEEPIFVSTIPKIFDPDAVKGDILFSPTTATRQEIAKGNLDRNDIERFMRKTSFVGMNFGEASEIVGTFFDTWVHPAFGLRELGARRGVVTHESKALQYWDDDEYGEIEPITDSLLLLQITRNLWNGTIPARDQTGPGDAVFGGTVAALAMKKPIREAVQIGLLAGAGVYCSLKSNLAGADLNELSQMIAMKERFFCNSG